MCDRKPTDDFKDLDVNTSISSVFMFVTLQAAVHVGRGYSLNLRSVKNQSSTSVELLYRTTERLIKEPTEIKRLSTINWDMWRESSLLCDRAVRIMKSKTYVFSDSVLCLGGISPDPVQAKKDKITWYLEARYLKELNQIDGNCQYSQLHMSVERERKEHTTSRLQQHQQPHQEGLAPQSHPGLCGTPVGPGKDIHRAPVPDREGRGPDITSTVRRPTNDKTDLESNVFSQTGTVRHL